MQKNISRQNPFGLRIPEDLKAKLEAAAVDNARSVNSEMILRLAKSFDRPLQSYSDGELVSELLSRYAHGEIAIRIGNT